MLPTAHSNILGREPREPERLGYEKLIESPYGVCTPFRKYELVLFSYLEGYG
jgi:hypothetical protein